MGVFSLKEESITTGTTANTFRTLLGLKFPNTAGNRGRLRKVVVGGGGAAAQDLQVSIRIRKTDNTSDGTSTSVATNKIGQHDGDDGIPSNISAIGKNYTAEPTSFDTETLGGGAFNTRGTYIEEWEPGKGPLWGKNQTLAIEGAMGTGVTAANLEIGVEWEE